MDKKRLRKLSGLEILQEQDQSKEVGKLMRSLNLKVSGTEFDPNDIVLFVKSTNVLLDKNELKKLVSHPDFLEMIGRGNEIEFRFQKFRFRK